MFHYPAAEHKGEPKEESPEGYASGTVEAFDPKDMLRELWLLRPKEMSREQWLLLIRRRCFGHGG